MGEAENIYNIKKMIRKKIWTNFGKLVGHAT